MAEGPFLARASLASGCAMVFFFLCKSPPEAPNHHKPRFCRKTWRCSRSPKSPLNSYWAPCSIPLSSPEFSRVPPEAPEISGTSGGPLIGDEFGEESPRTSPKVPQTSPEVFAGDFSRSSLTVELNSNQRWGGEKFTQSAWTDTIEYLSHGGDDKAEGMLAPSQDETGLSLRGVAFVTVLAVLASTLPSFCLIKSREATVTVLTVSADMAVSVVTATPLKLKDLFPTSCESLVFSEHNQLSQANAQFHVE